MLRVNDLCAGIRIKYTVSQPVTSTLFITVSLERFGCIRGGSPAAEYQTVHNFNSRIGLGRISKLGYGISQVRLTKKGITDFIASIKRDCSRLIY